MRNSRVHHSSSFKTGHYHSLRSTEPLKLNVARVVVSGEEAQPPVPSPPREELGGAKGAPSLPPRRPGPRPVRQLLASGSRILNMRCSKPGTADGGLWRPQTRGGGVRWGRSFLWQNQETGHNLSPVDSGSGATWRLHSKSLSPRTRGLCLVGAAS